MLSLLNQPTSHIPKRHSVSFAPDVEAKEELRAIQNDKKKVTRLFLQSDVAFVVDKSFALELLEEAKAIIDKRFSGNDVFQRNYLNRKRCFDGG